MSKSIPSNCVFVLRAVCVLMLQSLGYKEGKTYSVVCASLAMLDATAHATRNQEKVITLADRAQPLSDLEVAFRSRACWRQLTRQVLHRWRQGGDAGQMRLPEPPVHPK